MSLFKAKFLSYYLFIFSYSFFLSQFGHAETLDARQKLQELSVSLIHSFTRSHLWGIKAAKSLSDWGGDQSTLKNPHRHWKNRSNPNDYRESLNLRFQDPIQTQ